MKLFPISSDRAALALTETGGHLADVTFTLPDGEKIRPMHTAHWAGETLDPSIPPILQMLRGDFFCAPFSTSDVIPGGEKHPHGLTANGKWMLDHRERESLVATLDGEVLGARVRLELSVRDGEAMVYQRHTLTGGTGPIPLGHHAMLRATQPLQLGFSRWVWAGTPPDPIEVPPAGRSLLAYPQQITDFRAVRRADGGTSDLTTYPWDERHEDLLMISADRTLPFAWTAATNAEAGWVWFALKDPRVLPSTTMWMSNGGRTYAPWQSRHDRVIGLEEVCSYFHLGHRASTEDNTVSRRGIPTFVTLDPGAPTEINYAFGLAPVAPGFGAVVQIEPTDDGVVIRDGAGHQTFAACDPSFIAPTE